MVDVATRSVTAVTRGPRSMFFAPTWLPDGRTIAALGHRMTGGAGSRNDIWLFAADGSDATPAGGRNLSAAHDLMPGSGMTSDVTRGEAAGLVPSRGGRWLHFSAPIAGAYELWRIRVDRWPARAADRGPPLHLELARRPRRGRSWSRRHPDRLPPLDRHRAARPVAARHRRLVDRRRPAPADDVQRRRSSPSSTCACRSSATRRSTGATSRAGSCRRGDGPRPLVVEIHGGPHTLYGWAPVWEFQVLAAAGIGVFYCNPRGSEGYGEAFNEANHRDWGPGPMRDVLAGVDALVADGLADPDRLGVTGGSYGGYLTNWIVAHDQRFRAAMTCRSVSDMSVLFSTGDISGGDWPHSSSRRRRGRIRATTARSRRSRMPTRIRTPLLIQHSEHDLRTTIAQAEALFTVLRSLRRPVRLMRVPDETHELTRSGTPVPPGREPAHRRQLVPPLPRRREARPAAAPQGPRRPLGQALGHAPVEVYPLRPMTATRRPNSPTRERADELIRAWDGRPGPLGSLLGRVTAVDQVGVEERVDALKRRSIKKASKVWALELAISMMDLTTLEGKDTPGKIRAMCVKAMRPQPGDATIPSVAAVCVYPALVGRGEGRPARLDGQGRQRGDRLPVRPDLP